MRATTSIQDYRDKVVSVWVYRTTPTDSDEPSWIELRMTRKEAAILEIRTQPFFSPNAK
jgi:hypothetical protein